MANESTPEQIEKLLAYVASFDAERYKRWINVSHKLAKFGPFFIVTVQGLGKLDSKLLKEDELLVSRGATSSPLGDMSDHITISYLWVLGAYEVVRSICQRAGKEVDVLPEQTERLKQLKRKFERLRVPLAKFEAANKHRTTDSCVAYPGVNTQLGIAWQLSQDTWIARRELSDSMLELLEGFNA